MKNIGLFLGSFNPIHNGHLMTASYCLNEWELDEILFVVAKHNPLKSTNGLIPFEERVKMCEIALSKEDKMKVENIEKSLVEPYFTCNTIAALKEKYNDATFHIIIGIDNWLIFDKWHNVRDLFDNNIIVLPRGSKEDASKFKYKKNEFVDTLNLSDIKFKIFNNVKFSNYCVTCNLSSTMIRDFINKGKCIIGMLDTNVEEYIKEKSFYI